jgi:RNA polymerase sigma factor (sigma-70 family)
LRDVGSPITIGALSATAPPSEARSARGLAATGDRADGDDRALIDAVRTGNLHAFGTLYERHVGAVRGLARRLCGNATDADDVVADVFTNTLRAIKSGRGPRDEMRSYVLTATRHTVIKLHTRRDSGRAIPTCDEELDKAVSDDPFAGRDSGSDTIGAAFVQLPDRFRNVLWLSCVEGMPPAEVGNRTALSTGAVTSLTLRARRALARSYLLSRISQPIVSAECIPIRDLLPSIVRDDAAPRTISRVDSHLATCCECREAFDEMQSLAGSLRSFPWLAATLAWLRSVAVRTAPEAIGGLGGAAGLAPVLVTVIAIVTFTAGDAAPPAAHMTVRHAAAVSSQVTALPVAAPTEPETVAASPRVAPTPVAMPPLDRADRADRAVASEPRSTAALRESGVPTIVTPVAGHAVDVVGGVVSDVPDIVVGSLDPIDDLVAGATVPIVQVGHELASTADTLVVTTEQLVDDVGDGVVGLLEDLGAGQLAATVEPIIDTTTELLVDGAVEPVVAETGDVIVDSTTLVASTADSLLALINPH